MQKFLLIACLLTSAFISQSYAADSKTKSSKKATIEELAPYDDSWKTSFPGSSPAFAEKSAKAMGEQEKRRKVASDMDQEFFEGKMSKEMKAFRELFLKVKTAEELDKLLAEADKNFDSYPADLQFIVAQAVPLRAFRGIVWKLIPTVEDSKTAHSLILTQVKNMAVNMKIFLPTEQWQAGFDYVSQPYMEPATGSLSQQFPRGSEVHVQAFIRNTVIPALRISAARMEKINLSGDFAVWDNKLLYGNGSFPSAMDRYALFGEVERHTALMYTYANLSELCYQSAYSQQGALKLNQEIARLYGWDSVLSKVDGVPAAKRVKTIRSPAYAQWGVLFGDGTKWTQDAWMFMQRSVDHGDQMWQAMKNRPVSEIYMADSSAALPFQRPVNMRFENLKKMMDGPTAIRSFVTDEKATVNLKEFYMNPPKDLKAMYAIGFDKESEMLTKTLGNNSKVQYRNYFHGRGTEWNIGLYKKYFPDVQSSQDLLKTAKVLSQGWGSFVVAVPLANYLN
ncbi:hypothetical protein [Bdellovibrio sp. HCB337]|uniref:hypothetical protein n=1 Tax=Bdellovibrio sp. HCB337 TaxID=3394358 RepID=UPI0039A731BE